MTDFSPREIVSELDRFIVGQADAKRAVAIALRNRWRRLQLDDRLREEDCRSNIVHVAPTRSMLADALAQYLVWKQWRKWLLVVGSHPEDKLYGDALRRSAALVVRP